MYRLFFTPEWFNGLDIVFDIIGLAVAILIAAYSWRLYRLHKGNQFAYFSLAFILVALGLVAKSFTSSVLYFFPVRETVAQILKPTVGTGYTYSFLYYRAAFFLQMLFMLGAWLLIFLVSQKARDRLRKYYELSQIALFIYLIFLISVVSNFEYFVFYLTSSVFLGLIVLNYYKNYLNTDRNHNAFLVLLSFLFILIGNLILVFVFLFPEIYVLGELVMLVGFLMLLYTYVKVTMRS